ncbi:MAG: hypothetical protein FWC23_08150 [Chitinispirillia bacterium]|nr:hypothetical protein [Chitinispirillia bacterium]MCL2269144.1 hypothetical protein [Chitinispirillia bacterium]
MRLRVFAVLALFCFAGLAHGSFSIEPPMVILKTSMNETMAWIDVVHNGNRPIGVEVSVLERELDLEGGVKSVTGLRPLQDFTVYPAQIILRPGERQRVQVAYRGKQKIAVDRAFTLLAREVPLPAVEEVEGVRVGVNLFLQYQSVLAFETGKAGSLTFVSSKDLGGGKVEVIVENKSQGRVSTEGLVLTVGRQKIRDFTGKGNSIMPGHQRRFTFEHPRALTAKEISFGYR